MNNLMLIGSLIAGLSIIISLFTYYIFYRKSKSAKKFSLPKRLSILTFMLVFSFLGAFLMQEGQDQLRLELNAQELNLLHSGKSFSDFTDTDKALFVSIQSKYLLNTEEKMKMYREAIFNWAVDRYLDDNKHRKDLTRDQVERFVLKDWQEKRQFYSKN